MAPSVVVIKAAEGNCDNMEFGRCQSGHVFRVTNGFERAASETAVDRERVTPQNFNMRVGDYCDLEKQCEGGQLVMTPFGFLCASLDSDLVQCSHKTGGKKCASGETCSLGVCIPCSETKVDHGTDCSMRL